MIETPVTRTDIATLAALVNGIGPANERNAGAALAERMRRNPHAVIYDHGISATSDLAQRMFAKSVPDLTAGQMQELLTALSTQSPAFFRQLRADLGETVITLTDITALAALANGIIPADERDAGAAAVHAGPGIAERMRRSPYAQVYADGLKAAHELAKTMFAKAVPELDAAQLHELLTGLSTQSSAFFRQLRADVCALYLSDAGVWQRIGFPGPSTDSGGYPDFDQPQL